jgi:RNA polymerase sigma-70 factor (ECF subfamily)
LEDGRGHPLNCPVQGPRLGVMADRPLDTATSDEQLAAIIARRGSSETAMMAARNAFGRLYERYARRILAFLAARVRRDELEDLSQEVWQRIWRALPDGFDRWNFRAWLYQIARNVLIDSRRRKRPEPLGDDERLLDPRGDPPDEPLMERERMAALKRCLDQLGAEAAELVRARLAGEGYPEICGRLGLMPAKAHKLFHQAKVYLQTCVERARA